MDKNNDYKEVEQASRDLTILFMENTDIKDGKLHVGFAECARIEGMKVFVCTNDHTPAHFHIKCKNPSLNCKFSIDDCKKESGYYMDTKYYDKLKTWFDTGFIKGGNKTHRTGKEILQEKWNEFHSEK